jgi:hypothetical protein
MTDRQLFVDAVGPVERMEYDDGTAVFAADVGPGRDVNVDIVGETVIVVVDGEQYEFETPGEDAQAFIKNGVLTVEVDR